MDYAPLGSHDLISKTRRPQGKTKREEVDGISGDGSDDVDARGAGRGG